MALIPFGDCCIQSSITTTTGPYQLTTNVGAKKTWRSQLADLAETFYYAENDDASIWEEGFGVLTYGSPDTITRTAVLQSSTGSAIDWSGVTVYVLSAPVARANPGRYVNAKTMWVPETRRPTTAVGAANKTIAAADVAGIFTLDNSAAARSITLPALSAVGEGFSFRFMGLSNLTLISLIPNGAEAIDYSSGGTTVKLPGKVWIDVWHDGSQWRTNYPYSQKVKLLEFTASGVATLADTGGSAIPSWVKFLRVEWDVVFATNNITHNLQLYDSGGSLKSGGADYYYINDNTTSGGAGAISTNTSSSMQLSAGISNSSTLGQQGFWEALSWQGGGSGQYPTINGLSHYFDQGGVLAVAVNFGHRANFVGPFTGFKQAPSSGNCTGGARVYAAG